MWKIIYSDVIHYGRSPGGDRFTDLMDSCIRAQAYSCGIPDSEISTNLRTNIPDGGVDTEVRVPIINDTSGWLNGHKTIWQYKATDKGNITNSVLGTEVNKSYAKKCIIENYAYRLCICDNISASEKKTLEKSLNIHIHSINPDAPEGRVLSADDVALWLSYFPALILHYFRPGLSVLHMESWRNNITDLTPTFIDVPAWQPIIAEVKKHVDFSNDIADIILSITGEAGVGKTRMVYECLKSIPQAERLVVYTNDDPNTYNLAVSLANNSLLTAIVVVDECDVILREKLRNTLRGYKTRIRVITIDNSEERLSSPVPQIWLTKMPSNIVEKILAANFSHVPEQRRHIYADLAGGFTRLAADLCNHDRSIVEAGDVFPALSNVRDYLIQRLNPDELKAFLALSMFTKVGMKGEVSSQLKDLCILIDVKEDQFKEIAYHLHDTCGFVGIGGRYFYITPEIIAHIGFDLAWQRWAKDPEEFLQKIPPSLLEPFLKRASKSAKEEVRRDVGNFFLQWANALTGTKLVDVTSTKQIATLVEVEPHTYLPILQKVIEQSSYEDLLNIGEYSPDARWGPRRLIVWLLERMSAFPEQFCVVEKISLRLALAENEPHIGNNATGIWKQLFRISLSGTAVPFVERLHLLKKRILSNDTRISNLAVDALGNIFQSMFAGRIVTGPTVVAGVIPPEQWRPRSQQEYQQCINNTMVLLQEIIESTESELQENIIQIVTAHIRILLESGFLGNLKSIYTKITIDDELRLKLIENIDNFLKYNSKKEKGYEPTYINEAQKWLESLISADFHGRLLMSVGIGSWYHFTLEDEKSWKVDLRSIATYCVENPKSFEKEIKWLCSSIARDAMALGDEMGKIDENATLLDMMFASAIQYQSSTLARGYIHGLVETYPVYIERINNKLDTVQGENPPLAYDLFMAGGEKTKAAARTLELIDQKKLPISFLQGFTSGLRLGSITPHEFFQILERLVYAIKHRDALASRIAIELISYGLIDQRKEQTIAILKKENIQPLVWDLMETTALDGGGDPHWWVKVLELLASMDADRAVKIAAHGLISSNLDHKRYCEKILVDISLKQPETVMRRLGEIMMDENLGWHFFIDTYRGLISSLPESVVINWIKVNGVEAARHLARHLPKPYINSNDEPTVPVLTEFVLKEYEDDTRTFHEFCAGIHALESYSGDIAARHEQEAEVARNFFSYPLKRICEWARIEYNDAKGQAKQWRQFRQEMELE